MKKFPEACDLFKEEGKGLFLAPILKSVLHLKPAVRVLHRELALLCGNQAQSVRCGFLRQRREITPGISKLVLSCLEQGRKEPERELYVLNGLVITLGPSLSNKGVSVFAILRGEIMTN